MRTLTELGRQVICKRLGIYDENSIFIKNADAFVDRVQLYSTYTNVLSWIDIYKDELKKFESEEEYVKFLEEQEILLYTNLSELVYEVIADVDAEDKLDRLCHDLNYKFDIYNNIVTMAIEKGIDKLDIDSLDSDTKYEINIDSDALQHDDINCIRIYYDKIIYNTIQYICSQYEFPDTMSDLILDITGSVYLASMKDIELYSLDYRIQKRVEKEIGLFLSDIVVLVSPKYINPKTLIGIDNHGIFFLTSPNIPISTVSKIYDEIEDCGIEGANGVSISISKFIIINNVLCLKDTNSNIEILSDDDIDITNTYRAIKDETPTIYDRYFQINGV